MMLLLALVSSCGEQRLLSSCSVRASHLAASLDAEHRLVGMWASVAALGLSNYGSWALEQRLSSCGAPT